MVPEHVTGTTEHKAQVGLYLGLVAHDLFRRAVIHDNSKFAPEEYAGFEAATAQLKTLEYGSEAYQQALANLKSTLQHHYMVNDHHPEFFAVGIQHMNLIQLIEMVCDWMAAVKRVQHGDIWKSLEINKERFGIEDQLYSVIVNTVKTLIGMESLDYTVTSLPSHPARWFFDALEQQVQDDMQHLDTMTSVKNEAEESITIIVNGREQAVETQELSCAQIVRIAFEARPVPTNPTVIYWHGPQENPEGSLLGDQTIKLTDGMVFSVAVTNNA